MTELVQITPATMTAVEPVKKTTLNPLSPKGSNVLAKYKKAIEKQNPGLLVEKGLLTASIEA